jgi:hypothetical protein
MTKFLFVPTAHVFLLMFLAAVLRSSCVAQSTAPASDPQALQLAAQAIAAMTRGAAVNDVTLSANVTWIAGSDTEAGTGTLTAKGTSESRVDLSLRGGSRTEIRNAASGVPQGVWLGPDGASHASAQHNGWTDASWFFPALTSLADSKALLTYVGKETQGGVSVYHLHEYGPSSIAAAQHLSQMDFWLDATSFLPVAVAFNVHPDDNMNVDIPVEVFYSDYQTSDKTSVPMHIRRYVQGSLDLDATVTSVVINSGLQDTEFAIQ